MGRLSRRGASEGPVTRRLKASTRGEPSSTGGPVSADDLELSHHPVVLVVEHVAVHHEDPGEVGEPRCDVDDLARIEPPGVLQAALPGRRSLAVAADGPPLLL